MLVFDMVFNVMRGAHCEHMANDVSVDCFSNHKPLNSHISFCLPTTERAASANRSKRIRLVVLQQAGATRSTKMQGQRNSAKDNKLCRGVATDKDEDAAAEPEEDQSDAESDGGEGTQAAKTKQSKQTAKKPAPKKAAPKKPLPKKADASKAASAKAPTTEATSTKEVRFEDPDLNQVQDGTHGDADSEDDSGNEASEEEKSGDDIEMIAAALEVVSDGELSELGDDEVEQLKETHEPARMDLSKQATEPLPDKDNGSLKHKSADVEVGQEEAPVAKKKRDSA